MARKDLPSDIITDLLSRIPLKSVVRFRCVSKYWLYLITYSRFPYRLLNAQLNSDHRFQESCVILVSNFVNHQFERSESKLYSLGGGNQENSFEMAVEIKFPILEGKSFEIKTGACDGMICLSLENDTTLCLCNPSTRDYKILPLPVDFGVCGGVCGFGFDSSIDDYKVVSVFKRQVYVFSVKRNSWKSIGDLPYSLCNEGIHLNGCIYWAGGKGKLKNQILCFDVSRETFREVSLPPFDRPLEIPKLRLLLTRRRYLCVWVSYENGQSLWVMKEKEDESNGARETWSRMMVIPKIRSQDHSHLYPKCFTNTRKVLVAVRGNKFVMYDPKEQSYDDLCINGIGPGVCQYHKAVECNESLISPDSIRGMNDID